MDAERLAAIPLFAGLSRHDLERVARLADEVDVPEGKRLLEEGRLPHEFFVVEEGRAVVSQRDRWIAELGPGDFFGEIAILAEERRTATVTAATPMRLIVMTDRDFREMARTFPEVAERVLGAVRERLARTAEG
ncbi:MAG TPA: cyclic nucleotide-binding domain-containing protein [Actinomycetota bacterium]|nr:cyclic nucleotide-binding domain-containing protein [Actinomycetota bacterium]